MLCDTLISQIFPVGPCLLAVDHINARVSQQAIGIYFHILPRSGSQGLCCLDAARQGAGMQGAQAFANDCAKVMGNGRSPHGDRELIANIFRRQFLPD
jgi:hypothetical protein